MITPDWLTDSSTRVNLEFQGVEAVNLVIPEGLQPALLKSEGARIPFGFSAPHVHAKPL